VEGGSENDYDYCSGDPINCFDVSDLYGYSYTYEIGPYPYDAQSAFYELIQNFGSIFPVAGCDSPLVEHTACSLEFGIWSNLSQTQYSLNRLRPPHFCFSRKLVTWRAVGSTSASGFIRRVAFCT